MRSHSIALVAALAACAPATPVAPAGSASSVPSSGATVEVARASPSPLVKALVLALAAQQTAGRADQVRAVVGRLRALSAGASEREKALVERAIRILERVHDGSLGAEQAYAELRALLLDCTALAPDDAATQVQATLALFTVADRVDFVTDQAGHVAEPIARAEHLLARYPGLAAAHELVGALTWATDGDPLRILRELRRCHALDPTFDCDKDIYTGTVEIYQLPRCEAADLRPGLAVQRKGAGAPFLGASDVLAVAAGAQAMVLHLTPEGVRKSHQAQVAGEVTVLVEGKPVGGGAEAFLVQRKLILQERPNDASAVCLRVEQRKLPADLAPTL